jgi:hypothetical protein
MAIGNIDNVQQLNSMAAQFAGSWRSLAEQTMELQNYVIAQGSAGLQALGFSSADAASYITECNYMATLAQVVQGLAAQPTDFNFISALIPLTGPS